jgi:parvulin-like peptidyl-prolyl isomerase
MLMIPFRNATEKTKAQTTANNLLRQIGGDTGKFDDAWQEFDKPNSGYISGEGFLYKDDLVRDALGADFVNTAFALKQGQVSTLMEGKDGYYILKVTET